MLLLLACTHQELDSGITVTPTPYMWKAKKAQRKAEKKGRTNKRGYCK